MSLLFLGTQLSYNFLHLAALCTDPAVQTPAGTIILGGTGLAIEGTADEPQKLTQRLSAASES